MPVPRLVRIWITPEAARQAFASYLAPEVVSSGTPSVAGDVYSASAILYESLTGIAPTHGKAEALLAGARLSVGNAPVPDEILALLARGLASDPARRENDVTVFRRSVDKVLFGGPYQTSTFNLAFFMNQRFAGTIEVDRREVAEEEKVDVGALQAAAAQPKSPLPTRSSPPVPRFGAPRASTDTSPAARAPAGRTGPRLALFGSLGVLAVAAAAAAWFFSRQPKVAPKPASPATAPASASAATPLPTVPTAPPVPVFVGKDDPAFQAALEKQLQLEMKRVQEQIQKEQAASAKKRQAEQDKIAEERKKSQEAEEALRLARERADKEELARVTKQALEARQREEAARAAAAAAVPKTKDGDLLELSLVDQQPLPMKMVRPEPPPPAKRNHTLGTVILRVLVNENGRADKVEVMRDTNPRVGLGPVSADAVKGWEWKPATKDGKRVKTWITVPIPFKL